MFRFGGPDNQESVATSIKKLLVAKGIATSRQEATVVGLFSPTIKLEKLALVEQPIPPSYSCMIRLWMTYLVETCDGNVRLHRFLMS